MKQDSLKYIHISDMQFKINPKHLLRLYFLIHVSSSCQYMYTYIFPLHQDKAGGSVIYRHNIVRGCTGCLNQKQRKEGTWKKRNYRSVLSVETEGIQGKIFISKAEDIEVREQVEKAPLLHIFWVGNDKHAWTVHTDMLKGELGQMFRTWVTQTYKMLF